MTLAGRRAAALAGSLLSCAVFGAGVLLLHWPAALILLGFWLEEVATLAAAAATSRLLRRRSGGRPAGAPPAGADRTARFLFPAVHLGFILVLVAVDATRNRDSALLLGTLGALLTGGARHADRATLLALAELCGWLLAWHALDVRRTARAAADGPPPTEQDLAGRTTAAALLPHATILLGGAALLVFRFQAWLAVGLVAGKCLVELLLLPAVQGSPAPEEGGKGKRPAG